MFKLTVQMALFNILLGETEILPNLSLQGFGQLEGLYEKIELYY